MPHIHTPGHDHHHHHQPVVITHVNNAFIIGIVLNLVFVLIEVITGFYIHSLSLLSDAGHNLADVAALALSLLSFRLLKVKSNDNYTYGYRKTSVITTLFNAIVLLVSIGAIAYAAVHRFLHPEPLPGKTIAIVAAIGIVINFTTAILFLRDKEKDLNIKSAYLHLMSDAVVSLGLVIGGIVISYTHWFWLDPLLSIIVAAIILLSTVSLLKESLRLSLDGVPKGISLNAIKTAAIKIKGIQDIHHIHVWAISTTENAMTAHIVLKEEVSQVQEKSIKQILRHEMEHQQISHITLETERMTDCNEKDC